MLLPPGRGRIDETPEQNVIEPPTVIRGAPYFAANTDPHTPGLEERSQLLGVGGAHAGPDGSGRHEDVMDDDDALEQRPRRVFVGTVEHGSARPSVEDARRGVEAFGRTPGDHDVSAGVECRARCREADARAAADHDDGGVAEPVVHRTPGTRWSRGAIAAAS